MKTPVWVLHSTGDKLFPLTMPQRIVAASNGTADLLVTEGLAHNEPILKAVEDYWGPVVERVLAARLIRP